MIICFNYLAVINPVGELIWNSHGAAHDSDSFGFAVKVFADKPESLRSLKELLDVNSALFPHIPYFSMTKLKAEQGELGSEWQGCDLGCGKSHLGLEMGQRSSANLC